MSWIHTRGFVQGPLTEDSSLFSVRIIFSDTQPDNDPSLFSDSGLPLNDSGVF